MAFWFNRKARVAGEPLGVLPYRDVLRVLAREALIPPCLTDAFYAPVSVKLVQEFIVPEFWALRRAMHLGDMRGWDCDKRVAEFRLAAALAWKRHNWAGEGPAVFGAKLDGHAVVAIVDGLLQVRYVDADGLGKARPLLYDMAGMRVRQFYQ